MSKYNLILIPAGAIVPEEITLPRAPKGDFVGMLLAGEEQPCIAEVSARELQALVEYRDLFDVDCTAVIGLHGAMYNTIWNTYVSSMKRTTVDSLIADIEAKNDERSNAGQVVINTVDTRRASMQRPKFEDELAPDDDSKTGDLGV